MLISYNKDNGWGGLIHNIWSSRGGNGSHNTINIPDNIRNALNSIVGLNPNEPGGFMNFEYFVQSLNITDESFQSFTRTMQANGTVFNTLDEAMEAYRTHLATTTTATSNASGVFTRLANSATVADLKTRALATGMKILSSVGWMALITGVTELVRGLYQMSQSSKAISKAAAEIGESFKETTNDIESYKEKINELHGIINNSTSSIEEVTDARKSLLEIQEQLIENYGTEAERIGDVTNAINDQADSLDNLTAKKYQEAVIDFNSQGGFWVKASNFFLGKDNMERMKDTMEDYSVDFDLRKIAEDMKWDEGLKFLDTMEENFGEYIFGDTLTFTGTLDDVYDNLLRLQTLSEDFEGSFISDFDKNNFFSKLTNEAKEAKDYLEQNKDWYYTTVLQEGIYSNEGIEKGYKDKLENLLNIKKSYDEAFTSGDEEAQKRFGESYAKSLNEAISSATENGDLGVVEYLEDLYPEFQKEVAKWNFEYDIKPNINRDGIAEELDKQLKNLDGLSSESIKSLTEDTATPEQWEAYKYLDKLADQYGVSFDQFIDILEEDGKVLSESMLELTNTFGEGFIKSLTTKELEALKSYNGATSKYNKYLEEENAKVKELNQDYWDAITERYNKVPNFVGNVDINNRPVVKNSDGSYSTTQTAFQEKWVGAEETGGYRIIHYTPILPDGTILEDNALNEYIDKILNSSNPLEADKPENGGYGIVYKVDTEVNNEKITDENLDVAFDKAEKWDDKMHETQETIYETEIAARKAIDENGTAAENAAKRVLEAAVQGSTLNKTDFLSSTEILSEVEKLSAGLDQLDKIYADVYDKEDFDWSSILNNEDFTKEFGDMTNVTKEYKNAYEDFIKVVSNSPDDLNACQSAFDDLATAYIANSGVLGKVTDETKNATIAFLEQKGVVNAEEVVVDALTAKKEALALKEQALTIVKDGLTDKTREAIVALLDEAGASETTRNYLFYLIAQEEAFNSSELDVSGKISKLQELASWYGQTAIAARAAYILEQAEKSHTSVSAKDLEDLTQETIDLINKPVEVNYQGGSATKSAKDKSSKDSSNEPSEVTQEFNWIEKYLEAFARKTEKIMNRISDYLSFKKNISTIKSAIKAVRSELSANEKALAEYEKQMNAVGLSQTYIDKIKNGELNIETITGYETDGNKDANAQLIEKIEKYQDLYDQYTSIEDTIEELRETEKEWLVKNLEYINEYYQKLADIKSLAIDQKQDNIDLKEAQGKRVVTSDYSKLISNNEAYIKSLRTTYKKTNAEFNKLVKNGTIDKESAEWFEWKENLADLNFEIVQAQINTAEWKDEINQIKIDGYTSSLDRLEAKYDKLNTTISRKESSNIVVTQSDYNNVIKNLDQQISKNNKLLALYKELQSQTQKNSEKWKEYQELIEQTESTVESLRDSIIETAQKIANVIAEIRDLKLEDNENVSNLLSAKYDNATTASERNKNLDEQDALAKSNLDINNKAYKDYTDQVNKLGMELSQYVSNATKNISQSNALIADTSNDLQKERENYNSYANAYAIAQEKYSKATTKEEKLSAKAEIQNLSVLMDESAKKVKELETALSSYNTGLEENQSVLSQLDGYEFGKEIDLSKITDEDLLKKAAQYNETLKQQKQALIDAGLSEQEAIKTLRENASQRIQNILDEAKALDVLNQAMKNQIKSKMDLNKTQGYTISDVEYENYISKVSEGIKLYEDKYKEALDQFNKNLKSGVYEDNEELYLKDKANIEALKTSIYESYAENESMLDEIMQLRIDALTEEKEAIQKLYDLQERRYKLEEAQYNLEKAKQRTNLVYNGTEFVYQADTNALKEAEKALEEAKYNELINKIDDWIDAMEEAKEDFNLYDADGNALGSTEDIIKAAKAFGDNLLDGLTALLANNGWEYSNGELKKIQTFANGGIVGKSSNSKFDTIAKSLGEDKFVAVKDEEMIFTKAQSDELYKQLVGNAPTPVMDLKPIVPDNLVKVNTAPNIEVNLNGAMQFNEVQNVNDLSKAIINGQLRGAMKQGLGRLKM